MRGKGYEKWLLYEKGKYVRLSKGTSVVETRVDRMGDRDKHGRQDE